MFESILTLTLAALSLQSISASPIQQRADQVTCKPSYKGLLYLTPTSGNGGDDVPVSLLGGAYTHQDYNGDKSSVLLTKGDSGPVVADEFEFLQCDSKYEGYEQGIPHTVGYGILRPSGSKSHCITASAGTLTGAAPSQPFTDSVCPKTDDVKQLWSYFSFAGINDKMTFLEHDNDHSDTPQNHKIIISSSGKHGQVQLVTNDTVPAGAVTYQFKFNNATFA